MTVSPGVMIGHYEVQRLLGRGGMGEVYLATDLHLKRNVALKVLAETLTADQGALGRFQQEAEMLAKLGHPNIVAIYDFDRSDKPYVVMELLEGETLRDRLERGPIPWRRALDIGAAIADGLAAAHRKGIIHRDLKPENVFITSSGQAKILDFGIAQLNARRATGARQEDLQTRPNFTTPGAVIGTLTYMSPEQVRGEPVDDTTDIFSLGCVIHEMISGTPPFRRSTAAETHAAILGNEAPEIPERLAPREVTRTLNNCLGKDPGERFQAASDLALTLRGVVPVSVLFNRTQQPVNTRARLRWAAAGVLFLAITLVGVMNLKRPQTNLRSVAVLPFENASGDRNLEYLADGIAETVMNQFSEHRELRVVPRNSAFQFKAKTFDVGEVARKLRVDAVVTGRIVSASNRLVVQAELIDVSLESQLWGKRFETSLDGLLDVERKITSDILGRLGLQVIDSSRHHHGTSSSEAHRLYLKGRHQWEQRTEASVQNAIHQFEAAVAIDPEYALAHTGLADSYMLLVSYGSLEPAKAYPAARAASLRALSINPNLAEARVSLGAVKELDFDWSGAEDEYKRAIELKPRYMTAHHWYGQLLTVRGRFADAEKELRRGLDIEPDSVKLMLDLAILAAMQRDYVRAADACRAILRQSSTYEEPALEILALALAKQGKFDEAAVTLKKRLALGDKAAALITEAHLQALRGERREAIRTLAEIERLPETEYISPYSLAVVFATLGDRDAAFAKLREAQLAQDEYLPWLKIDPDLDPLRSDPRYDDLITALRL